MAASGPASRPALHGPGSSVVVVLAAVLLGLAATHLTGTIDTAPYGLATCAVSLLAAALGAAGAWRVRRTFGAPGWLLAGGLLSSFVADAGWSVDTLVLHRDPWPSWTDAFYVAAYSLWVAAVLVVVRRRNGRDVAALLDASILTVGFGVLAYVFVIAEAIHDPGVSLMSRLVGGIYPLFDVFFVGLIARLMMGSSRGRGPLLFLAGGIATQFLGDVLFTIGVYVDLGDEVRRLADAGYLVCNLLIAWVVWHRDADQLVAREEATGHGFGSRRLVLLAVAGLLAPLTLLLREATGGSLHATGVALGAILLFLLTLCRMWLLVRAVEQQSRQLAVQARTDALTGLANRRTFDFALERAMRAAARGEPDAAPVTVALIDLDRFKRYNDALGHGAGDQLLRECAAHWAEELAAASPTGVLARYGGEEFAIALQGLPADAAADVLRRLLLRTPGGQTFSAGVAAWDGSEDRLALLRRADELMYAGKAAGRNRVIAERVPAAAGRSGPPDRLSE